MKTFFDFEFIENGRDHVIEPISIGMVREDGAEYYAEFSHVKWQLANNWVLENVKPYLTGDVKGVWTIASEIERFVGDSPEFWAYFADYDWILLCQLYGRMIDVPKSWPYYCLDLKQYMYHLGVKRDEIPVNNDQEHHALADAKWNLEVYNFLKSKEMKK